MKTKTKLLIGVSLIVGVIAALVINSIGTSAAFYLTVDEVSTKKQQYVGKSLKMSGDIVGETVKWDANKILLTFELEGKNGERIPVTYEGTKPDTLNDGWEAIVTGKLTKDGTFVATDLLVKCPSKYEEMEKEGETPPADHPDKIKSSEGSEY
jgi:cytochrome c-type biogenesis protein CcmE